MHNCSGQTNAQLFMTNKRTIIQDRQTHELCKGCNRQREETQKSKDNKEGRKGTKKVRRKVTRK